MSFGFSTAFSFYRKIENYIYYTIAPLFRMSSKGRIIVQYHNQSHTKFYLLLNLSWNFSITAKL